MSTADNFPPPPSPPPYALGLWVAIGIYLDAINPNTGERLSQTKLDELQSILMFGEEYKASEQDKKLLSALTGRMLRGLREGELRSWGRRDVFENSGELPAFGWYYVNREDINWEDNKISVPISGQVIYDIKIAPADISKLDQDTLEFIEGELNLDLLPSTTGISESQNRRRGPLPETRTALMVMFSDILKNQELADFVKSMSQERRRLYIAEKLGLPKDEYPARSYVHVAWKMALKQASLPEL